MASYTHGAGMDYHQDGRSNRYTASPSAFTTGASMATSPRPAYGQDRETVRSSRPMRSHQVMESGEPRYQSSNQMNSSRNSPVPAHIKQRSSHIDNSTPRDHVGNSVFPQDGYSMHHQKYHDNQSQVPMAHYDVGQSPYAVVTPNPPPDMNLNNAPNTSSSNSQGVLPRRPAYLLHRDLVIGKGSYGQVCIASRGETEGQQSSSGKRKKFACKCVVLRNDAKYIAKLQEEVNVLRELRGHENVILLYDVFCVDNELFIITELGRGGDLFHLLTTHPKHGVTEAYAGEKYFCFIIRHFNSLSRLLILR